jgi:flagellar hook-length control protein FliK
MINTNELSKLAFFPEIDHKKQENSFQSSSESNGFLAALQSVSEETKESIRIENHTETESPSNEKNTNSPKVDSPKEKTNSTEEDGVKNDEPTNLIHEDKKELSSGNDVEPEEELGFKPLKSQPKAELPSQEKLFNNLTEYQTNSGGLSISSILLPVFQKDNSHSEIFQEKLKKGNFENSNKSREIFHKSTNKKESGDLLKSAFENSERKFINQSNDFNSKDSKAKDPHKTESSSLLSVKQLIEETKGNQLKTQKIEDKLFDSIKTNQLSLQVESEETQSKSDKKIKPKSKTSEKLNETSEKSIGEKNSTEKAFSKENFQFSRQTKEEVQTTITDKLKRTDANFRKEQTPENTLEPKFEISSEPKPSEKASNSSNIFEQKQKVAEQKSEVKATQKQESLSQNFKEIVKAAKFHIVENGRNTAEISLQPKDLGKVTLFVSEENNRLEGKITVENESTRQMILGDLANLKADLKAGGLDLFEIQVDLRSDSTLSFTNRDDSSKDRDPNSYSPTSSLDGENETSEPMPHEVINSRLLDVKV